MAAAELELDLMVSYGAGRRTGEAAILGVAVRYRRFDRLPLTVRL